MLNHVREQPKRQQGLNSVLIQLRDARNQNLIADVNSWPSANGTHSTISIKFHTSTCTTLVTTLAQHFKTKYRCTNVQKYVIGTTPFLTFMFPEALSTVLEDAA